MLKEIHKSFASIYFVANETSLKANLKQLSKVLAFYFQEPIAFENYEELFLYLVQKNQQQKIILMIDEFSYLLKSDRSILSILQNIIDQYLIESSMKLILSGSHMGMLEDMIAYQKPLYGRSTFKIQLKPFNYQEAALFYPQASSKIIQYFRRIAFLFN